MARGNAHITMATTIVSFLIGTLAGVLRRLRTQGPNAPAGLAADRVRPATDDNLPGTRRAGCSNDTARDGDDFFQALIGEPRSDGSFRECAVEIDAHLVTPPDF